MLYRSLHSWVTRNKPKPEACSHCGQVKPLDWANVSGEYRQDLDDWVALCRKCHRAFDRKPTCPNGHERTPENLKVGPDGRPRCRPCANQAWRRRYYEKQNREVPA
jgi:hypothetical protein